MPHSRRALLAPFALMLMAASASWIQAQEFEPLIDAPPLPSIESSIPQDETPLRLDETPFVYQEVVPEPVSGAEFMESSGGSFPVVRWTLQADALFLRRTVNGGIPLVAGTTPYGAAQLDLPYRFGPRVSLMRHNVLGSEWGLEFNYLSVDGWSKSRTSDNATQLLTNPPINFAANTVASTYRESLYSTEFNARRPLGDCCTILTGFRYLEVHSDLFNAIDGLATHRINASNHLYGWQVGADARILSRGDFDLNGWVKAGIYGNSAGQGTNMAGIGGLALDNLSAEEIRAAFAGELGLTGTYRITDNLSFRAGYQLLFLDGLATAVRQIPVTDIAAGLSALDMNDSLLYHGGFTGLEFNW